MMYFLQNISKKTDTFGHTRCICKYLNITRRINAKALVILASGSVDVHPHCDLNLAVAYDGVFKGRNGLQLCREIGAFCWIVLTVWKGGDSHHKF